jgi:DNA-binding NtrC family response regulator
VLDEVGELAHGVQAKLLRAIQEGEIQPVGSGRVERVDVRLVACTNRDLAAEARAGRFREDLYYRLAVIELVVPPLRERAGDVPALAEEMARRYGEKFGLPGAHLAPDLVARLAAAPWPGNVRQLENTVARLLAMASGPEIEAAAFEGEGAPAPGPEAEAEGLSLREQVEAFERSLIARALAATHGNQSEAARRLGASRVTLVDKIKKYGLG